jgi:hypothetical protein
MKHLKLFEELLPSTYLSAGDKLRKKGFEKRGTKLIQYALGMDPEKQIRYVGAGNRFLYTTLGNLTVNDSKYAVTIYDDKMIEDELNPGRNSKEFIIEIEKDRYGIPTGYRRTYIVDRNVAVIIANILNKYFQAKNMNIIINANDIYKEKIYTDPPHE